MQQLFDRNVKVTLLHCSLPVYGFCLSVLYAKSAFSWLQALQADYGKQKQEIRASFTAAKVDMDAMMAAGREHFSTSGAAAQLVFETAKAEAQEGDSEEYNVLKLSLEAQVHGSPTQQPHTRASSHVRQHNPK